MLYSPPRHILIINEKTIELWQRRGHIAEQLGILHNNENNFTDKLIKFFTPLKSQRIIILLNTNDLRFESESVPKVGWLDRRKLIQHRLNYLFQAQDMRASWSSKDKNIQYMAGIKMTPRLQAILQTAKRLKCKFIGIHHLGLESLSLLPKSLSDGIILIKQTSTILLVGYQNAQARVSRIFNIDQDIDSNIDSTCQYMRRYGWNSKSTLHLTSYGITPPALSSWPNFINHDCSQQNGQHILLGKLFTQPSNIYFKSGILQRRQRRTTLINWYRQGSMMAAGGSVLLWVLALVQLHYLNQQNARLQHQISALPPSFDISNQATLDTLTSIQKLSPTIARLAELPIRSLNLTLPTPLKNSPSQLFLQTDPLPAQYSILSELPDWQLDKSTSGLQGNLLTDDLPQPQNLHLISVGK